MLKRVFDIVLSMIAIIALSPVLLILAILVYVKLGSPILFTQKRPGLYGESYTIYKFRSMTNETDEDGNLLPNEERLTPFGQKLRRTSLDELPELFNVLKGEMSLVGPRPLMMRYLSRYSERQARRHEVKPGITGWAQVHGRNCVSWPERFNMDVWYVDNQSLWLDIKILFKTLGTVWSQEGAKPEDDVVTVPFQGNKNVNKQDTSNQDVKRRDQVPRRNYGVQKRP